MAKPVVVVSGAPPWADAIEGVLGEGGFTLARYPDRAGYVTRLVDDRAVMVLVDGARPDWSRWTATPKASPATRRIPVVLVAADPALRDEALTSGADACLSPGQLAGRLPELLASLARPQSEADAARLADQCREPLPPLARQGVEKFNAGEYYPQHDLFEEQWMAEAGPVRDLYRAILQVGIAYYQITRGNHRGALKMLLRSMQWLALLPDVIW